MASKRELKALITLAGKIDPSLQSAMLKATGESRKLSQNLKSSSQNMKRFSDIAKGTFVGALSANLVSGAIQGVRNLAGESLQLASDLKEVQNVVDTTFGLGSKQIDIWSKQALKAYGLSELHAKQFTGTMGAMLKSSGLNGDNLITMSQNLTGLAGDFASFYNLRHEEAFTKIRAGISGETEPLKQLGINLSVANLEAYALSKGITTSYRNMDQASQAMLRYNYLMEVSKDAQGDFAKTSNEAANQQRLYDTNLRQLSATIASKALPLVTQFYQKANEFMTNVDIEKATARAAVAFDTLGNMIGWARDNSNWLIPTIGGLAGAMTVLKIINTVTGLYRAWTVSTIAQKIAQDGLNVALRANPIGLIVTGIGILIAAGIALWRNWKTVEEKILGVWNKIKTPFEKVSKFFGIGSRPMPTNYDIAAQSMDLYASGGIASRPSIFGEAGPEMAIPLKRNPRSLGLLNQTARILGAGGGPSISITQYITGSNAQEIAQLSKEAIISVIEEHYGDKGRVSFA